MTLVTVVGQSTCLKYLGIHDNWSGLKQMVRMSGQFHWRGSRYGCVYVRGELVWYRGL
jgi:hypothetical protein